MPITRHQYPILERSSQTSAVINPRPADAPFPRLCLMTFFREPLARLVEQYKGRVIGTYRSEMRPFEVYALHDGSRELCAVQAAVGAAASAMLADWLYGKGVETILCCGSCGVLEDIPAGDVILPVRGSARRRGPPTTICRRLVLSSWTKDPSWQPARRWRKRARLISAALPGLLMAFTGKRPKWWRIAAPRAARLWRWNAPHLPRWRGSAVSALALCSIAGIF